MDVLPPVNLPSQGSLENNNSILLDTSGSREKIEETKTILKNSNCVIIVFDSLNEKSFESIENYWINIVEEVNKNIPIIIVKNKIDISDKYQEFKKDLNLKSRISPLVQKYKQIVMGIDTSAKEDINISELLYCAQSSVLYPIKNLINIENKLLSNEWEKALLRIFRIIDKDNDNKLSEKEFIQFNHFVYDVNLTKEDLNEIKIIIKDELNNNSNQNYINFEGFKIIIKTSLEWLKIQNVWIMLRKFNYDNELILNKDLYEISILDYDDGSSIEFSSKGIKKLKSLFYYNKNINRLFIDEQELQNIFFSIGKLPWNNINELLNKSKNSNIEINITDWLKLWNYLLNENYKLCYKFLVYLGFNLKINEIFIITNYKNSIKNLKKSINRSVYKIMVIGKSKIGKSELLNSIFQNNNNKWISTKKIEDKIININYKNLEKCFIFTEIPEFLLESYLNNKEINFNLIKNELSEKIDFINKYDLTIIIGDNDDCIDSFFSKYDSILSKIPSLKISKNSTNKYFSYNKNLTKNLIKKIFEVIESPDTYIDNKNSLIELNSKNSMNYNYLFGCSFVLASLSLYFLYKKYKN